MARNCAFACGVWCECLAAWLGDQAECCLGLDSADASAVPPGCRLSDTRDKEVIRINDAEGLCRPSRGVECLPRKFGTGLSEVDRWWCCCEVPLQRGARGSGRVWLRPAGRSFGRFFGPPMVVLFWVFAGGYPARASGNGQGVWEEAEGRMGARDQGGRRVMVPVRKACVTGCQRVGVVTSRGVTR